MAERVRRHFTVYSDDPRFVEGAVLDMSFGKVKVKKAEEMHKDITSKKILLEVLETKAVVK